jgi:hypothetical protein
MTLRARWVVALVAIALVVTGGAVGGWPGGLLIAGAAATLYVVWLLSRHQSP